jgi:hypothetical protein
MPSSRHDADAILAAALAAGRTMASAAEAAGVCTKTASRRLADPAFRRLVADLKREATGRAIALLAENAAGAVVELTKLSTGSASEKIRLVASKAVIELALRGGQWEDDRPQPGGDSSANVSVEQAFALLQAVELKTGQPIMSEAMLSIEQEAAQVLPEAIITPS